MRLLNVLCLSLLGYTTNIKMDQLSAVPKFHKFLEPKKIQFCRISRFSVFFVIIFLYQKTSVVGSKEVCDIFVEFSECPENSCCTESKCEAEGGQYRCCEDPESDTDCSLCKPCGRCFHSVYV